MGVVVLVRVLRLQDVIYRDIQYTRDANGALCGRHPLNFDS